MSAGPEQRALALIDTHCHLDVSRFDDDRAQVLERAWAAGLSSIVVPAIGPDAWNALLALPAAEPRVQVGLGIHPQLLPELDPAHDAAHLTRLEALLGDGRAIAVGECGLDGPSKDRAPMARQIEVLKAHFALARKLKLPVLLHCLRAHSELRALLRVEPALPAGILLHSYSGSADEVKFYLEHGCWFSFAGPVTFLEARRPVQAMCAVPLERLLAETDAPDQAPHPHRGQRSEPSYLPRVVEAMAMHRGLEVDALAAAMKSNAQQLFGRPL